MITTYDLAYESKHKDIVLVGGCFDVLHYGHVTFLKKAKSLGHALVIALENDEAIVASKNRQVFHTQQQRADILESLTMVDEVILLPELATYDAYLELVKAVNPRLIVYTAGDPYASHKDQQAQHIGAKSMAVPFENGFSTTDLLKRYHQSYIVDSKSF